MSPMHAVTERPWSVRTIQGHDRHVWIVGDFGWAVFDGTRFGRVIPAGSDPQSAIEQTSGEARCLRAAEMTECGVEIRVNTKVGAVSPRAVELSDGTTIESDTLIRNLKTNAAFRLLDLGMVPAHGTVIVAEWIVRFLGYGIYSKLFEPQGIRVG